MTAVSIPKFIVDDFLLGRVRPDVIERFTQSGDIVSDVWAEFAKDLGTPVRVLIAPSEGVSAVDVGAVLHHCINAYRAERAKSGADAETRKTPNVSPLENFVAVRLYWDELVRVVLPLTRWWSEKNISALNRKPDKTANAVRQMLETEIKESLVRTEETAASPSKRPAPEKSGKPASVPAGAAETPDRKIRDAAPIAALIGLFRIVKNEPNTFDDWESPAQTLEAKKERLRQWLRGNKAQEIARTAVKELAQAVLPCVLHPDPYLSAASKQAAKLADPDRTDPPVLINRVFSDRKAGLAVAEGVATIKADAANRLFDISCRNVTWAIIDAGIAANHPAFIDHSEVRRRAESPKKVARDDASKEPTRVRAILDFTPIERIRSFDLIGDADREDGSGGPEREKAIKEVIELLRKLPDLPEEEKFEEMAAKNLDLIARQLKERLQPDWNLIEPLIRRSPDTEDPKLVSGHGTHVAGILGADWRKEPGASENTVVLQGVCPDIYLYDLRVINDNRESTEFAILAALEYVQFANRRTSGMQQVIQGVNISLSIPHEVRSYACGATPICVACDNLVGAGVVVVAAAGNRGWNEQEIGFGSFVFCSITDPGNAQEVITVGATHRLKPHTYGVSFFSSRGPTGDGRNKPDLVAPGEKIRCPVLGDTDDELDGTSMAAPFVSGAAAMLIARHGELYGHPRRVKQILCES